MSNYPQRSQQRAARRLSEERGISYQKALQTVREVMDAITREPARTLPRVPRLPTASQESPHRQIPFALDTEGETCVLDGDLLNRHLVLAGRTGSRRSTVFQRLFLETLRGERSTVLIDPVGAMTDDILGLIVKHAPEHLHRVEVVDFSRDSHVVAFNPIDVSSTDDVELAVASVIEMIGHMMGLNLDNAPKAVNFARTGLLALTEANIHLPTHLKLSVMHLRRFWEDDRFRDLVLGLCSEASPHELYGPENAYSHLSPKLRKEMNLPVLRCLQRLAESPALRGMFQTSSNQLDLARMIRSGKIIIIRMSTYARQWENGKALSALMIAHLMYTIDDWGVRKDPDTGVVSGRGCRLFIDHTESVLAPHSSLVHLLTEAPKWDLGVIFSTAHLPDRKALMANCRNFISMGLFPEDAAIMSRAIAPHDASMIDNISALPDFHMYANILTQKDASARSESTGAVLAESMPLLDLHLDEYESSQRRGLIAASQDHFCVRAEELGEDDRLEEIKVAMQALRRSTPERPAPEHPTDPSAAW